MQAVTELGPRLGFAAACAAVGLPKATFYRRLRPQLPRPKRTSHRALGADERRGVLDVLNEQRFADLAPAEVHATLLDEGRYLCSERTMYRVLAENAEVRERRDQLRHPAYKAPELLATAPNQLWSWDITKLLGPQKWTYFHLYVILDVYSRYVVGWMLAHRETAATGCLIHVDRFRGPSSSRCRARAPSPSRASRRCRTASALRAGAGTRAGRPRLWLVDHDPLAGA